MTTNHPTTQDQRPENPHAKLWQRFLRETAGHQLKVGKDDGDVRRHLRMKTPGTYRHHWDVVTWPGALATRGSVADGYLFSHSHDRDMIKFFSPDERYALEFYSDGAPCIDFRYWAQQLGTEIQPITKAYSPKKFMARATEILTSTPIEWTRGAPPTINGRPLNEGSRHEDLTEARAASRSQATASAWLAKMFNDPYDIDTDLTEFTDEFVAVCYCLHATAVAYNELRGTTPAQDDHVVLCNGIVQNNTSAKVFDITIVENDVPSKEGELANHLDELLKLHYRITTNALNTRRPVSDLLTRTQNHIEVLINEHATPETRAALALDQSAYHEFFPEPASNKEVST